MRRKMTFASDAQKIKNYQVTQGSVAGAQSVLSPENRLGKNGAGQLKIKDKNMSIYSPEFHDPDLTKQVQENQGGSTWQYKTP